VKIIKLTGNTVVLNNRIHVLELERGDLASHSCDRCSLQFQGHCLIANTGEVYDICDLYRSCSKYYKFVNTGEVYEEDTFDCTIANQLLS
jgi:hypothetical protein